MPLAISQEYPLYDGIAPSWSDVATVINVSGGVTLKDIEYAAFKFGSVVSVGNQVGASGGRIMKRTSGSKVDSCSATYYLSGWRKLVRALIPLAPRRGNQALVGLVHFDILTQHTPPGETEIYERGARGCRLLKWDEAMAEGDDTGKIEVELNPSEIYFLIDGIEVVLI